MLKQTSKLGLREGWADWLRPPRRGARRREVRLPASAAARARRRTSGRAGSRRNSPGRRRSRRPSTAWKPSTHLLRRPDDVDIAADGPLLAGRGLPETPGRRPRRSRRNSAPRRRPGAPGCALYWAHASASVVAADDVRIDQGADVAADLPRRRLDPRIVRRQRPRRRGRDWRRPGWSRRSGRSAGPHRRDRRPMRRR